MLMVRNRSDGCGYSMELTASVPISNINTHSLKWELNGSVKFRITDVNLTELDTNHNPVVTRIGQKKKVNVTVSGYMTEPYYFSTSHIKGHNEDRPHKNVNIENRVLNITFFNVRVLRDKEWDDNNNKIITVPKLMVDNTHELYGFLKPIYVNDDVMSILSEKNIYLTFEELKDYLTGRIVDLNTTNRGTVNPDMYWTVNYIKKGDNDGD